MMTAEIAREKQQIRLLIEAEAFVQRALSHFGQTLEPKELREVARRVVATLPK